MFLKMVFVTFVTCRVVILKPGKYDNSTISEGEIGLFRRGGVDGDFYLVLNVTHSFPSELGEFQQRVMLSSRTGSIFTKTTLHHGVRPRAYRGPRGPIVDGQLCSCRNGLLRDKGKASTIHLDNRFIRVQPTKRNIDLTSGTESQDTE